MGKTMGTHMTRALKVLCISLPLFAAGCGGDDAKKGSPGSSEENLTVLDCTEVDGRPEELPPNISEIYHPDVIAKALESDDVLRKRYGKDEVTDCDQARKFAEIYAEEEERIVEEWLEAHPQETPEDVLPDTDDEEAPAEGEPTGSDDEEGEAVSSQGDTSSDAAAPNGAEPPADTEAATDIQKVHSGYDSYQPNFVRISMNGSYCSAQVISSTALLTAAHCMPADGYYWTQVEQQRVAGAAPYVLFSGYTWIYFSRHSGYWGAGNYYNDLAIGTLYYSNQKFPDSARTRLWMGSISNGTGEYVFGYGSTYTGEYYPGHLHYGTATIDDVTSYQFWSYPNTSPARTTCPGDSGGAHGLWQGGYFMLYGVNSSGYCGEDGKTYQSVAARVSYNMWWIEGVLGKACNNYSTSGQAYKRCW